MRIEIYESTEQSLEEMTVFIPGWIAITLVIFSDVSIPIIIAAGLSGIPMMIIVMVVTKVVPGGRKVVHNCMEDNSDI